MENNPNNLFVEASRLKLRFATSTGHVTVEDLWDLSLKSLDEIGVRVMEQCKPRLSLLENPDKKADRASRAAELALEIIKFVIGVKQDENKAAVATAAARQQRAFLTNLRDKKKIDQLEGLSLEEIDAQLAALGEV